MMQRLEPRVRRQVGFSRTVSARILIIRLPDLGSLAQRGTRPQRSSRSCRAPSLPATTTRMSLAGATLKLGRWSSTPLGSARNRSSRNESWVEELNLPHMPIPYPHYGTVQQRSAGAERRGDGGGNPPAPRAG